MALPNYTKTTGMVPQQPAQPLPLPKAQKKPSIEALGSKGLGEQIKEAILGGQPALLTTPNYPPEVQNILYGLLGTGAAGLQQFAQNVPSFAPQAAEARRVFYQEHVPTIAERFTAFGGEGAQRSSAFPASLGAAGAQLESQLAALGSQFEQGNRAQILGALLSMLQAGGQQPYSQTLIGGTPGAAHGIGSGLGYGFGQAAPAAASGLWGLIKGAGNAAASALF